jgi:hypothetical protein
LGNYLPENDFEGRVSAERFGGFTGGSPAQRSPSGELAVSRKVFAAA